MVYYSNRFLNGKHDEQINDAFGEIYRNFAELKEIGESTSTRINLIAQSTFSEDSVMRYHFLAFPNEFYDFKATTDYVLTGFLKRSLRALQADATRLSAFIENYVGDLSLFFKSFLRLVSRAKSNPQYYKLLCVLGPSTHLYPLLIRLEGRGLLDSTIADGNLLTFADLVEIADVRIYKTRGTNPMRDMSYLARDATSELPKRIQSRLSDIVRQFMDDPRFESELLYSNMYANEAILHMLIEAGEEHAKTRGSNGYTVSDLVLMNTMEPTIDHLFVQTPTFTFPSRGFASQEEYIRHNDRLGNLCVLEKAINSRCQDKTPDQKLGDTNLYKQSKFDLAKALVAETAARGKPFDATGIEKRTRELAQFVKQRWPLW